MRRGSMIDLSHHGLNAFVLLDLAHALVNPYEGDEALARVARVVLGRKHQATLEDFDQDTASSKEDLCQKLVQTYEQCARYRADLISAFEALIPEGEVLRIKVPEYGVGRDELLALSPSHRILFEGYDEDIAIRVLQNSLRQHAGGFQDRKDVSLSSPDAASLPEETVAPLLEETVAPLLEETVAPLLEETVAPLLEETVASLPEETVASLPEETVAPPEEEAYPCSWETWEDDGQSMWDGFRQPKRCGNACCFGATMAAPAVAYVVIEEAWKEELHTAGYPFQKYPNGYPICRCCVRALKKDPRSPQATVMWYHENRWGLFPLRNRKVGGA